MNSEANLWSNAAILDDKNLSVDHFVSNKERNFKFELTPQLTQFASDNCNLYFGYRRVTVGFKGNSMVVKWQLEKQDRWIYRGQQRLLCPLFSFSFFFLKRCDCDLIDCGVSKYDPPRVQSTHRHPPFHLFLSPIIQKCVSAHPCPHTQSSFVLWMVGLFG